MSDQIDQTIEGLAAYVIALLRLLADLRDLAREIEAKAGEIATLAEGALTPETSASTPSPTIPTPLGGEGR